MTNNDINLHGRTILIIEDDSMVVEAVSTILELQGADVLSATTGQAGINTFRRHWQALDLVLLDLHLPDLNGENVLRTMLSLQPDVKVVVASGDLSPHQTDILQMENVTGLLPKPFNMRKLLQAMADVFANEDEDSS